MDEAFAGSGMSEISGARLRYEQAISAMREAFEANVSREDAGIAAVARRTDAVDALLRELWAEASAGDTAMREGVCLVAVGGYGRRELFPFSDVDLMFLLQGSHARTQEKTLKDGIRRMNQKMWDSGLRVSPMTRTLAECEKFDAENVEFSLSLLDARVVTGDAALSEKLLTKVLPKVVAREHKKITARLLEVTRARHAKYGDTLFHLEPNVKECPGGLRDAHVCAWLRRLGEDAAATERNISAEFGEARAFLLLLRCFLHLRHKRDDNLLDWETQDEAAAAPLGISRQGLDAAYWMRIYFRHARAIQRRTAQCMEDATVQRKALLPAGKAPAANEAFALRAGRLAFRQGPGADDPAHQIENALGIFAAVARTGVRLAAETELRLEQALPLLANDLEDGRDLWHRFSAILVAPHAGTALRGMHALGLLELLLPEFHGIDALVIRDAYHRYTVDEHTFVVIDTLHGLEHARPGAPGAALAVWAQRFSVLARDLPHPDLLYLAALLHDTGKGHASVTGHAEESARMAQGVLARLAVDGYEAALVLDLIRNHLEMSAALRRDVFDAETIRAFAARVPTPEALRMLALFTYADIAAVHPDALTPWKAENLWRLYTATAQFLDRSVDEERLGQAAETGGGETVARIHALLPGRGAEVTAFLDGFPRRYLQTRTPETMRDHFRMAQVQRADAADQIEFRYAPGLSELTLVTRDRPLLFASTAGALAGWGMNIVTADAFSNAAGVVVDSFRFTDTFRTLELNETERSRFVESIRAVLSGAVSLETLLAGRRKKRRAAHKVKVGTRIDFDDAASTHSTLLEVVTQDTPGLLRALSLTLAEAGCSIEVALVDTEGEMAIDVFYLTLRGAKLTRTRESSLRRALLEAIRTNVQD